MFLLTYCLLLICFHHGHQKFGNANWLTTWIALSAFICVQPVCRNACSQNDRNQHVYQTFNKNQFRKSSDITCLVMNISTSSSYSLNFTLSCTNASCAAAAYMTSESKILTIDGKEHYEDFRSISQLTNNCTNNNQGTEDKAREQKGSYQTDSNQFSMPQDDILSLEINLNCITRFPAQYFCNLTNLSHLDLSCNALHDSALLGFDTSCNMPCCSCNLASLSLKNNRMKSIALYTFCAFPKLRSLDLSHNALESVHEEAFGNLDNLKTLEMYNNKLVTLPTALFLPLQKLTELSLSENNLNEMGELNLSYLTSLKILKLDLNDYKKLPPGLFKTLVHLENLNLARNSISGLQDDFQCLTNLLNLDLSVNELQIISESIFYPLVNLLYLNLSRNQNIQIPLKAFVNNTNLRQLKLSTCKLKQFPNVGSLPLLTFLDISFNEITVLNRNHFRNLYSLTSLHLQNNIIKEIDSGAFDDVPSLKDLFLDNNNIGILANVLQHSKIEKLTMNNNLIENFSFDYIPSELQTLELKQNRITSILKPCIVRNMSIQSLTLSNNSISNLDEFQMPPSIRLLNLNYNQITRISFAKYDNNQPTLFVSNATNISIKNNNLSSICSLLLSLKQGEIVPTFDFRKNVLMCACELAFNNMSWLFDTNPKLPKGYRCPEAINSSSQDLMYFQNDTDHLTCDAANKNASCQCNLINDYNSMCGHHCPKQCFCYIDKWFKIYFINCRFRNLTTIPKLSVISPQINVTFSFNKIHKINSSDLVPISNAIGVYLDHNVLEIVSKEAFQCLVNVRVLALDFNLITHLPTDLLENMTNLQELHLRNNKIGFLDPNAFLPPRSLQVLTLAHNLLSDFPVWELPPWKGSFRLSLSKNPWSCNCTFVEPFRSWFQNAVAIVSDANDLHCDASLNDSEADPSFIFFNSSICYSPGIQFLTFANVTLMATTLGALLFVAMAAVLTFIYRREMQVLIYSKYGIRLLSAKVDDEDKTFDAFLSYCSADAEFVRNDLLPKLEQIENPYCICVHDRDFLAGNFISDNIQQAVHNSCRTIAVLSDSFIESDWCMFEFKTAYHKMLTDRCNRVIVIVLGKPTKEMDPDLKLYLKTNTYLTWGDKMFWEKLSFALPDRKAVN